MIATRFRRLDRQLQFLGVANHRKPGGDANLFPDQDPVKMVHASNGVIVEADNEIALAHVGAFGWAVLLDGNGEHTGLKREIIKPHNSPVNWDVLTGDADVASPNLTVFDKPAGYKFCRITGDREANALCGPDHRCVYPHNFAG